MKLLYCLQCQKGVYDRDALGDGVATYCPTCKKGLIYLGRENATISPQSKLSEYDAEHMMRDYLAPFKGKTVNYPSYPIDHDVMECEELLRHNPSNTEALFHLGMVYKSRAKLDLATHYFKQIIKVDPDHIDAHRQLAHISMVQAKYTQALDYLKAIQNHPDTKPLDHFHLAVAYYFTQQKDLAIQELTTLNRTLVDEDMKTQVETLLGQLG